MCPVRHRSVGRTATRLMVFDGWNGRSGVCSLTSALTATDKAKLVLHVDGSTYAFSDADPILYHTYEWDSTGLDWSSTLGHAAAARGGGLDGRDAERARGQRRQRGPDADADLRIGHVHLHGVGGEHRRRGDGDADEERRRRDDRVSGRVQHDAHRRGHLGGRPAGGAGRGRQRHQGEGDGRGRQRHPDLHGDGDPGEPRPAR